MTSFGVDHGKYISLIFEKINNVHLKDRSLTGDSVYPLQGDTDFKLIFAKLKELGYDSLYTLQTTRGKFGHEIQTIADHKKILQEVYNES
jgi:sugar phosphate isomerase/epimerase